MSLVALLQHLRGWLFTSVFLLIPGAAATVAWTPFLASDRIRSLFRHLPPFDGLALTYTFYGIAGSLPYVIGVGVAIEMADGGIWGPPILAVTLAVSIAYLICVPIIGSIVLPRWGIDWDPTGYGASTWALLALGGFWYALIFALLLGVLGVVLSLPGGW